MKKVKVCYYYCSYHVKDIEVNLSLKEAQDLCRNLIIKNTIPFVSYKIHYM